MEVHEVLQLVRDLNFQLGSDYMSKEELYKKLLGKLASIFESLQNNQTNDSYINLAEIIILSNKLMKGE